MTLDHDSAITTVRGMAYDITDPANPRSFDPLLRILPKLARDTELHAAADYALGYLREHLPALRHVTIEQRPSGPVLVYWPADGWPAHDIPGSVSIDRIVHAEVSRSPYRGQQHGQIKTLPDYAEERGGAKLAHDIACGFDGLVARYRRFVSALMMPHETDALNFYDLRAALPPRTWGRRWTLGIWPATIDGGNQPALGAFRGWLSLGERTDDDGGPAQPCTDNPFSGCIGVAEGRLGMLPVTGAWFDLGEHRVPLRPVVQPKWCELAVMNADCLREHRERAWNMSFRPLRGPSPTPMGHMGGLRWLLSMMNFEYSRCSPGDNLIRGADAATINQLGYIEHDDCPITQWKRRTAKQAQPNQ
jgi:hypothetical protein